MNILACVFLTCGFALIIYSLTDKKIPRSNYKGCLYSPNKEHKWVEHFDFPFTEVDCYYCRTGPKRVVK